MNVSDIQTTINLSLPIAPHIYKGNTDLCAIRNDFGIEEWQHKYPQKYQGIFYNDTLHKYGTYEWNYSKEKYIYEGKIYANNLDGYGILSYPNGSSFEGLFKYNERYGPGVQTYPDGTQDVGLWDSTNLVRLGIKFKPESVPNLSRTLSAKAYLIQYKKLINVAPRTFSPAEEILKQLNSSGKLLNERSRLYNKYIRNQNSLFFDIDNYDENYFCDEQQIVEVVVQFENGIPILEQKAVSDILAWNNEEEPILILKHMFLNRNYEHILSFTIDDILTGKRDNFSNPGKLENICTDFLHSCSIGDHKKMSDLITQNDINPDVCDLLGNSGVHFAASNGHNLAVRCLVNFGANLDILNDEGLTSLIICLLKYIAVKETIIDWEKAFLPSIMSDKTSELWRPYISETSKNEFDQLYILDLKCRKPDTLAVKKSKSKFKSPLVTPKSKTPLTTPKSKRRLGSKSGKSKNGVKIEEPTDEEIQAELQKAELEEKLKQIYDTILILLLHGADPNYGEVPLPPLILSIFTKEHQIIRELIENDADCNITTAYQNGSLTPLHIITSLQITPESTEVAKVLLKNGAQPNPRANIDHWIEETNILDPENLCNDEGKTPLQLLSMRYDFSEESEDSIGNLYAVLVEHGADPNLYYLGHTCLSLAIIRGNLNLINVILESYKVDPNQFLGCGMGVPLTVLILLRYKQILPVDTCRHIYEMLNNYDANPFNEIPNYGNSVEFCEEENNEDVNSKKEPRKKDVHNHVIQFLTDNAEKVLDRHIQGFVVKCIYEYRIECDFVDKIFDEMVKFVDVQDTTRILQILIDHDMIRFDKNGFSALVKYVNKKTAGRKKGKKQKDKSSKSSPKSPKISDSVRNLIKQELPFSEIIVPIPEIDSDEEKYIVCYNCYKKNGKILVLCPKCELVYFCSDLCNKISLKRITKHKCKGIFYNSELKKMLAREADGIKLERKMQQFKSFRDDILADPDHEFDMKYAFSTIGSKFSELHRTKSAKRKGTKETSERSKSKEKKTREDTPKSAKKKRKKETDEDDTKRSRSKKRKKSVERSTSRSTSKGKSKSKERSKSKKKDRSRSKVREKTKSKKGTEKSRSRSKEKKTKSKSRDRSKTKKVKPKDKSKTKKGKSRDRSKTKKGKSKDTSKSRKEKSKDRSKSRKGKSKDRSKSRSERSKSKRDKSRGKSKSKARDTSKGTRKSRSPDRKSKRKGDKSEMPETHLKDTEKRRGKTPFGVDFDFSQDISKFIRPSLVEKYKDIASDLSGLLFIMSMGKFFSPCCLLINGQLYYKFDKTTYCGLTYSHL